MRISRHRWAASPPLERGDSVCPHLQEPVFKAPGAGVQSSRSPELHRHVPVFDGSEVQMFAELLGGLSVICT